MGRPFKYTLKFFEFLVNFAILAVQRFWFEYELNQKGREKSRPLSFLLANG